MKEKIPIAVSACLLGHRVRYDGEEKANNFILTELSRKFAIISLCPETGIGMPVPRPPIQLNRVKDKIQAQTIHPPHHNYSEELRQYAQKLIPYLSNIAGYVFKARSPSCGVGTTPLRNETVNGIFAHDLLSAFPQMPIIDESLLETKEQQVLFIDRINQFYRNHCL